MRPEHRGEIGGTAELQTRLRHVYWICGAGKSTIARRLADRHGMRLYAADDAMSDHDGRFSAPETPLLSRFKAMDMDERWVNRSPETMFRGTPAGYRGTCTARSATIAACNGCSTRRH